MPSPEEFRLQLEEFLGTETYLRFVTELHRIKHRMSRLRYWQQELWESFVIENPDFNLSHEALIDALNVCELHGNELVPVDIPVFRGCLDYAPEYLKEKVARFPHATMNEIMVPESYENSTSTIWVCPKCDEIMKASRWHDG